MSVLRRALLTLALAIASAGFLQAQSTVSEPASASPAATAAAASSQMEATARLQASAPAEVTAEVTPVPNEAALVAASGDSHTGEVLMIVGAAGLITGLIIDEDGLTVAGAIVGLVGLYLYLK
ncbi:MAG TPA: hypothetical protein VFO06_00570 [Gemmatimonadales bacterium]|nr:hypothetical protein [Gemmatimonadales bacterium]